MPKNEIDLNYEEIVEFSGVEKFIDTPVKFYSSGMRVRLAFSVAAHLEPEILLIDEVLSVGDAAFQKKSLGKMEEVSRQGRTVLFVSHNMGAVRSLCSRAILLGDGTITQEGSVDDVVTAYLSNAEISTLGLTVWNPTDAPQCEDLVLNEIKTISKSGEVKSTFSYDESFEIVIRYEVLKAIKDFRSYIRLLNSYGEAVFTSLEDSSVQDGVPRPPGKYTARCRVPKKLLNNITYIINLGFDSPGKKVLIPGNEYLEINIVDTSSDFRYTTGAYTGPVRPALTWQIENDA